MNALVVNHAPEGGWAAEESIDLGPNLEALFSRTQLGGDKAIPAFHRLWVEDRAMIIAKLIVSGEKDRETGLRRFREVMKGDACVSSHVIRVLCSYPSETIYSTVSEELEELRDAKLVAKALEILQDEKIVRLLSFSSALKFDPDVLAELGAGKHFQAAIALAAEAPAPHERQLLFNKILESALKVRIAKAIEDDRTETMHRAMRAELTDTGFGYDNS